MLQADVSQLRIRVKALQQTIEMLRARNVQLLAEKEEVCARMRVSANQNHQACIGKRLKNCCRLMKKFDGSFCREHY